ncbi:MFS transporter [Halomonas sp. PA16-9]|uniref:MFS transporter n=1 Tax=Halomonas sp. PA16-9 TaxID=2576841 RepID=UPI0030EC68F7
MTNNNTATLPNTPNNTRYQILLVTLLSLNFGIVFFDRNALNFLMPFVQPELALTNLQIGLTASALSVTWAISGLIFGAMSDRSGRRKIFLIMATIVFLSALFYQVLPPHSYCFSVLDCLWVLQKALSCLYRNQ